jgi:hypothetical protein
LIDFPPFTEMKYAPVLLLVGLAVAFFGSLLLAASALPGGYDWRHSVMSSLASPRQNPTAYRIAAYGMAASGVFLSLLGFPLCASLRQYAPKWAAWARSFFVLGGVLLTISALITPGHHAFLGLGKAHAKFAQAAAAGFGIGMALTLPALLRLPAQLKRVRIAAVMLAVVPLTIYLCCRLLFGPPASSQPPSTHPVSLLASLAFWEWVGSASVYLFLALIVLALGPPPEGIRHH